MNDTSGGTTIRVAAAQLPPSCRLSENLSTVLTYLGKAAAEGVELLCFPETHLTGYRVGMLETDAPCDDAGLARAIECISATCAQLRIGAIVGTETPNFGAKPFNSAVAINADGVILATHHKSRLTPKDALAYTPGSGPTSFTFRDIPMGLVICFEGFRFPETTRQLARGGAKIVFHPQFNHVLPGMEWKQPVQEALIVARAAENGIFFVSANMCHPRNNCRSLIVGPDGLILRASELAQETLLIADLDTSLATRAFLGDDPMALMKALAEA
ncbi:MAG: carbon-nitrogen hydrolase family protein [Bryobacteraceae bacterium]